MQKCRLCGDDNGVQTSTINFKAGTLEVCTQCACSISESLVSLLGGEGERTLIDVVWGIITTDFGDKGV